MNTIIEKIRAEVLRLIRESDGPGSPYGFGTMRACNRILNFLDTLQEQPVKPSVEDAMKELDKKIAKATKSWKGVDVDKMLAECRGYDEQPVCEVEDEEYEQIKQKVCLDCPSHKDDYCGYVKRQLQRKCNYLSDVMYGYELGRQSKPRIVFSKEVFDQYDREQFINAYKPKVCEGLEEYAQKVEDYYDVGDERGYLCVHRGDIKNAVIAGAKWQAEHSPLPDDLEESANKYAEDNTWVNEFTNDGEIPEWYKHTAEVFKAGASWQKEQMMKEAVEGEVVKDINNKLAVTAKNVNLDGFKFGERVKIIIVKED